MKKIFLVSLIVLACSGCTLIGAGASKTDSLSLYDLGPLPAAASNNAAPLALSIAEVNTPSWLDSPMMYYRLIYTNEQQPRAYAGSRWAMPPGQLLSQRLKARLAQAGGVAVAASDGAANLPLLRIDADDFTQSFDSPTQSKGHLALRASLFDGRKLVAQKTFVQQAPALSADAAGGAKALANATDAAIADMMRWLTATATKKDALGSLNQAGTGKTP